MEKLKTISQQTQAFNFSKIPDNHVSFQEGKKNRKRNERRERGRRHRQTDRGGERWKKGEVYRYSVDTMTKLKTAAENYIA